MSSPSRGPVVIDTGVFGARLTPSGRLLASRYRPTLEGRPVVISFVTVAELEYGARLAGWGTDRLRRLEHELSRAEIVWPGPQRARGRSLDSGNSRMASGPSRRPRSDLRQHQGP